ncbi:MAG: hypothetical protein EOM23_08970, partial [Candidatus Moranbacteria bacterium]|nr:hypothetical protein [Candidatus Moranbacteria bacterium]
MVTKDENNFINLDSDEPIKDPKSGKTINRKRAFVLAGGAMMAGAAIHDNLNDESAVEILLDSDGDGIADAILSDEHADGIYEITADIPNETAENEDSNIHGFNPNTAPMASPGTV